MYTNLQWLGANAIQDIHLKCHQWSKHRNYNKRMKERQKKRNQKEMSSTTSSLSTVTTATATKIGPSTNIDNDDADEGPQHQCPFGFPILWDDHHNASQSREDWGSDIIVIVHQH
jgi:hypothetical protein